MSNKVTGYNRTQIILHWVIAALLVFQFVGNGTIVGVYELINKGETIESLPILARGHILLGILILTLAVWRVYLRLTRGAPDLPDGKSAAQKVIAKFTHITLYAAIFIMPLSGIGAWFGGQEIADTVHTTFKFVFLASIALHFVGAVYQQHVLKTNIIRRMTKAE
ncbi:MAG: cytochrome b/b6 domain-containing protein [Rhodobacteraceae bacterium]|nr:cytochrome b/b6 domain-containing protein [Paracoccaceae bacterium]